MAMVESRNTTGEDLAKMLKGGVIMDVQTVEQAKIAEDAGACAVMALERIPADIRAQGGVARMSDPKLIQEIQAAVTIPVMAKVRIGHTAEAQILEALQIDFIDESEVLTPADPFYHIDKSQFKAPFVCGATDLGEALRRVQEGAAMIRTKGEAGTGNVVEAVRHLHLIQEQIADLQDMSTGELKKFALSEGRFCRSCAIRSGREAIARSDFCCWWYCHSCRCSIAYAIWWPKESLLALEYLSLRSQKRWQQQLCRQQRTTMILRNL